MLNIYLLIEMQLKTSVLALVLLRKLDGYEILGKSWLPVFPQKLDITRHYSRRLSFLYRTFLSPRLIILEIFLFDLILSLTDYFVPCFLDRLFLSIQIDVFSSFYFFYNHYIFIPLVFCFYSNHRTYKFSSSSYCLVSYMFSSIYTT